MTTKEKWDVAIALFGSISVVVTVLTFGYSISENTKTQNHQIAADSSEAQKARQERLDQAKRDSTLNAQWRMEYVRSIEQFKEGQKEFASSVNNIGRAMDLMYLKDSLEWQKE